MPNFIYQKMLEIETPFDPANEQIDELAKWMITKGNSVNSNIPAGYTYLSQFIDHDIALDQNSGILPWMAEKPLSLNNERTPFFDLETIYGLEFPPPNHILADGSNSLLKIGKTDNQSFDNDLPRYEDSVKAQIIDQRNDENLGVAQTQVAFMRFHNAIVKWLGEPDTADTFMKARRIAILHYQWIVLKDFLPRIVIKKILVDVLDNKNQFYKPTDQNVFMPLEFTVGAFRMGHSMVRNTYNWNIFRKQTTAADNRASIKDLIKFTGTSCEKEYVCMSGGKKLPDDWVINWNWFYDINGSMNSQGQFFNFARKINTSITQALGKLSPKFDETRDYRYFSLPALDLYRARFTSCPTGQAIARLIDENEVLEPESLEDLLPKTIKKEFSVNTPIWFYFLAEAELTKNEAGEYGETLGKVGSRIISETIVELIRRSEISIFKIDFPNDEAFLKDFAGSNNEFGMPQMLSFIEKFEPDFINPLD